jgi:hypothetical protein
MRVQLIRKFADVIDGIDLTTARVGDIVNLKAHEAAILVMEGWACEVEPDARNPRPRTSPLTAAGSRPTSAS